MTMKDRLNNLYDLFAAHAETNRDSAAFISADSTVSFGEFVQQVDRLAAGLHSHGLGKGDRLATVAKNSISHIAVLIACARLGAVAFPVNWRLASNELAMALGMVRPSALFIENDFYSALSDSELGQIKIKGVFGTETPSDTDWLLFEEFQSEHQPPEVSVSPNDPAVIIATAAVAGIPRGAVLTHGNLLSVSQMFASSYHLSKDDRGLGVLPLFHIAGYENVFVNAMAGGASVILPGFDAKLCSQMMDEHRISSITTFPPMLEALMAAREETGGNWENLRLCWGILNPPEVVQQFLSLNRGEYWTGYGQTETTGIATLINVLEKPGSAGKVVNGLDLRIVNDIDQDVPVGEPGEIVVKGNLVFSHYWGDEEATAYAARGGWHHTGDLGRLDEEGYLYYVGRKPEKELIKSGGENIYPAEVEAAIRQLPAVAEVCVIGVPDEKWGETVKAVVQLAEGEKLDESQLLAGIAEHLAAYKKPRLIQFVDQLPRDQTGMIDRVKVKAEFGK